MKCNTQEQLSQALTLFITTRSDGIPSTLITVCVHVTIARDCDLPHTPSATLLCCPGDDERAGEVKHMKNRHLRRLGIYSPSRPPLRGINAYPLGPSHSLQWNCPQSDAGEVNRTRYWDSGPVAGSNSQLLPPPMHRHPSHAGYPLERLDASPRAATYPDEQEGRAIE